MMVGVFIFKMENKFKILTLIVMIIILANMESKVGKQTVAPECFEKEDCFEYVKPLYCGVMYDCVAGKCYVEHIKCQEICYGGEDEDLDGIIDCKDSDCFDSVYCPCSRASYNWCVPGYCYCQSGSPRWFVYEGGHYCRCV